MQSNYVNQDGSLAMSGPARIIALALALNIVLFLIIFLTAQWDYPEQLWARFTARLAFLYFMLTFVTSALNFFINGSVTSYLKTHRRYFGISFALTHSIHLVALSWFIYVSGEIPETSTLVGGGITYVFIWLLWLTSNEYSVRKLGARAWKALHKTGIYLIWLIFSFVYFGRVAFQEELASYHILFVMCMFGYSLRLLHYWRLKVKNLQAG